MKKIFMFIGKYFKKYLLYFLCLLISIICTTILGLLYPLITGKVVDYIINNNSIKSILKLFVMYITLFVAHRMFHLIQTILVAKLETSFLYDIRIDLFSKLLKIKGDKIANIKAGDIVKRFGRDVDQILEYIYFNLFYSIADIFEFIFQLMFIWIISIPVFIFTLVSMPLSFYLAKYFSEKNNYIYTKLKLSKSELSSWLFEVIRGKTEINLMGTEEQILNITNKKGEDLYKNEININNKEVIINQFISGTTIVINIALYGLSAFLIFQNKLSIGSFLALIVYFKSSIEIFSDIAGRGKSLSNNLAAIDRIKEIYYSHSEEVSNHKNIMLSGNIEYKNCEFSYDKKNNILNNFSIKINKGDRVAIVGENGAGKSTITYLLVRLFEVNKGRILINDIDINEYNIHDLRDKIGVVYQKTIIFNDTLRYNISFSNNRELDFIIWEVLKKVDMYKFVQSLPNKLDTKIDNDKLSGGQKQRLAIARIFIKNPQIIILDEVTSALDYETEQIVEESLKELSLNRTIIVIAHKLSSLKNVDKIAMVKNGCVIGYNDHKTLLQECEEYAKLFN